jgi:hypothetical protein
VVNQYVDLEPGRRLWTGTVQQLMTAMESILEEADYLGVLRARFANCALQTVRRR